MDIGNMAVYFVLEHIAYQQHIRPSELITVLRFVDDGVGFWEGSEAGLAQWMTSLNEKANFQFGLSFTFTVFKPDQFAQFLDINFRFNLGRNFETDIYRKPTDANRYLYYTSHHPPARFSQCRVLCSVTLPQNHQQQ